VSAPRPGAAAPPGVDRSAGVGERIAAALKPRIGDIRTGELVCITLPLTAPLDPCAVAFASRAPGEALFCFEQPERGGLALAGLGSAAAIARRGPQRFRQSALQLRELARRATVIDLAAAESGGASSHLQSPPAPVIVGGFAFAPEGATTPLWEGFGPASQHVPELLLARLPGARAALTVTLARREGEGEEALSARALAVSGRLRERPLPLIDPAPATRARVASAMPPEHYEAAVARARELIAKGAFSKIVLAREVQVHGAAQHDPAALFGALREAFPSCFCYCVIRGAGALVGASPELLLRREGARLATIALAGSSRRSADPAVDDHLGERLLRSPSHREEHAIVVERIVRDLRAQALWVTAAPEPSLVKVANIQHLASAIRAQLAGERSAIELAGALHPTPAVGGEPRERALARIPALEGLDRGWYAGTLGWCDARGDGEYCVALRCALLRGQVAHCFAGNGIVRESDPAAELAETEVKLSAILPLLAL
jgi:isochorismate synthase